MKARAVPIDYNIPPRELKKLLPNLNGVIVPDGGLNIINSETGRLHQFYRTTRRIVKYSMDLKDKKNETFPIFGINQGLYFLAMIAVDDITLLSEVFVANENRKIFWNIENPKKYSRMYANFDDDVLEAMTYQDINYQIHEVGILSSTFHNHTKLPSFFRPLHVDYVSSVEFITGIEAINYPIYAITHHIEFYDVEYETSNKCATLENNATRSIVENYSRFLVSEASKNSNKFDPKNKFFDGFLSQYPKDYFPLMSVVRVESYGIMYDCAENERNDFDGY